MPPDDDQNDKALTTLREATKVFPEHFDVDQGWHAMRQRGAHGPAPSMSWRRSSLAWWRVAAAVMVVVALGLASWSLASRPMEYATLGGQRLSLVLVDGTRVVLAPESHLQVSSTYATGRRDVTLSGEAYFTVVHDPQHPFVVRTGHVVSRDVGTMFDVRSYADDSAVQVAVTEGEVALDVHGRGATVILHAGDIERVSQLGYVMSARGDVQDVTAWTQSRMVFADAPLGDAIREISRTFGVSITLADTTLASKRVTGRFTNQPLDVVLDVVTGVVGAQYEREGPRIVIRPKVAGVKANEKAPVPPLTTVQSSVTHE